MGREVTHQRAKNATQANPKKDKNEQRHAETGKWSAFSQIPGAVLEENEHRKTHCSCENTPRKKKGKKGTSVSEVHAVWHARVVLHDDESLQERVIHAWEQPLAPGILEGGEGENQESQGKNQEPRERIRNEGLKDAEETTRWIPRREQK